MEFATPGLGRLSAEAGAQFAVFDMEHNGWSLETVKMLIATSRSVDLVPLVRVPVSDYHHVAHAMDVGARGLVIPQVRNADHIREVLSYALFPPLGKRGCSFGVSHDDYRGGDLETKLRESNESLLMIAQIETMEGVDNADAIAAVEGVDALWCGQFDLTTSMGIPGKFDDPRFKDALQKMVDACHRHSKAAVMAGTDIDQLCNGPAQGFRMLIQASDSSIYQNEVRKCMRAIENHNRTFCN